MFKRIMILHIFRSVSDFRIFLFRKFFKSPLRARMTLFFVKLFLFKILATQSYILYPCRYDIFGNNFYKILSINILNCNEFIKILTECEIFNQEKIQLKGDGIHLPFFRW